MMLTVLLLTAAGVQNCRPVADDVIRMRDLAFSAPVFNSADPDGVVTYSPSPGAVRVVQGFQLAKLAKRHGLGDGPFDNLCFQRAMRQIQERELLETLRLAVAVADAEVHITDFSRFSAPEGELVFPRSGLGISGAGTPMLWKGYVLYGGGHRFPIWAKVEIRVRMNRVVAMDNLVTGKPVRADQLRVEFLNGVPDTLAPAQSIEGVVGKLLLRPVHRGSTISLDDLATAIAIHRGDKVDVDYESPVVRLRFEAAAETDGRYGEFIRLRNLQTNQTFVAEVSGRHQARMRVEEFK
jgi:flagella basal body P-ring formation protein FlgA